MRSPKFSLYHSFNMESRSRPLPKKDLKTIASIIESSSERDVDSFLMLILEHYRVENRISDISTIEEWPYDSEREDDNLVVNLDSLPEKLKLVLKKFASVLQANSFEN
jgi:hypothetical protein